MRHLSGIRLRLVLSPAAKENGGQVTTPLTALAPSLAERKVVFAGRRSSTATPVAAVGPRLVIARV